MLSKPKDRRIAAILAFAGALPTPIPGFHFAISGLHKFYLGQTGWGIVYLLLGATPIAQFASAFEGFWYLFQDQAEFEQNFNATGKVSTVTNSAIPLPVQPPQVEAVADALRQLDTLRQDGLISEYEFEQKRRQLLDRII